MYFMYIEMQVCDMARHRTENNTTMLTLIVDDNRQHDQEKTKMQRQHKQLPFQYIYIFI